MEKISSIKNTKIKEFTKLKTTNGRKKFQRYLLEGKHPVFTALEEQIDYEFVLLHEDFDMDELPLAIDNDKLILITSEVADHLSDTVHNQGIFLVAKIDEEIYQMPQATNGQWLVLDHVQDPGNIGTMVRTADAAGFTGVIFSSGTADFYNPKILRSMQGSQYHLAMKRLNLKEWLTRCKEEQHIIYGSILDENAVDYRTIEKTNDFSLIMGNEGNGMSQEIIDFTDKNLYIPIKGNAESLNVGVAAGVLMFHLIN